MGRGGVTGLEQETFRDVYLAKRTIAGNTTAEAHADTLCVSAGTTEELGQLDIWRYQIEFDMFIRLLS